MRIRSAPRADQFALLIVAVGYEERSRHVAEMLSGTSARKIALAFQSDGVLSYDDNVRLVEDQGFEIIGVDGRVTEHLSEVLDQLGPDDRHIGVDISSFTKFHLAEIVDCLRSRPQMRFSVDFLYSPASSEGWETHGHPIQVAEPIHPAFASWVDDPSWPLTAIIGLGVEKNLALGVAEYLDVSSVYSFSPTGSDPGFDEMGAAANEEFFLADYVARTSTYDLLEPFDLFARLESLVYGLRPESRIAIVPLGPKVFALCALLATLVSGRAATVWRFSSGVLDSPTDVRAAGPIVSLRVDFGFEE